MMRQVICHLKCASGNIIELTSSDVEICDKNGWRIVVDQ